jgi:hypothetical protein
MTDHDLADALQNAMDDWQWIENLRVSCLLRLRVLTVQAARLGESSARLGASPEAFGPVSVANSLQGKREASQSGEHPLSDPLWNP